MSRWMIDAASGALARSEGFRSLPSRDLRSAVKLGVEADARRQLISNRIDLCMGPGLRMLRVSILKKAGEYQRLSRLYSSVAELQRNVQTNDWARDEQA